MQSFVDKCPKNNISSIPITVKNNDETRRILFHSSSASVNVDLSDLCTVKN